jgi:hypothetical protein
MSTASTPTTDAEIWRTAWLMRDYFGGADRAYSAALDHVRIVRGSPSGEDRWNRIAGALREMKSPSPRH